MPLACFLALLAARFSIMDLAGAFLVCFLLFMPLLIVSLLSEVNRGQVIPDDTDNTPVRAKRRIVPRSLSALPAQLEPTRVTPHDSA